MTNKTSNDSEVIITAQEGQLVFALPKLFAGTMAAWEAKRGERCKRPEWVEEAIKILMNVRARCQDAIRKKDLQDRITGVYRSGYPHITATHGEMRRIADLGQWTLERRHELSGTECPPRERWDMRFAESTGKL